MIISIFRFHYKWWEKKKKEKYSSNSIFLWARKSSDHVIEAVSIRRSLSGTNLHFNTDTYPFALVSLSLPISPSKLFITIVCHNLHDIEIIYIIIILALHRWYSKELLLLLKFSCFNQFFFSEFSLKIIIFYYLLFQ